MAAVTVRSPTANPNNTHDVSLRPVGHLAVQFAKQAGARVIGTASSHSREFVLSLGVDEFIDYALEDVAHIAGGVDLALDTVGGATTASLLPSLRDGGTLVTVAYPPETPPQDQRIVVEPLIMSPSSEQLGRIGELVASGRCTSRSPSDCPCRMSNGPMR